jgi:ATP-binding cassette subfamily B protein
VPGRARWRLGVLYRNPDLARRLIDVLSSFEGAYAVDVDQGTRRILVRYDAAISVSALEAVIRRELPAVPTSDALQERGSFLSDLSLADASLGTAVAGLSGAFGLTRILFLGRVFDGAIRGNTLNVARLAVSPAVGVAGIFVSTFLYTALKRRGLDTWRRLGRRFEADLRSDLTRSLLHAELGALEAQSTSDLANTVRSNLAQIERGFDGASELVSISANTVVLLAAFLVLAPRLAFIPILALAAMAVEVRRSYHDTQSRYEAANSARNVADRRLTELIEGLTTVKGFGLDRDILKGVHNAARSYERISLDASEHATRYPLRMEMITLFGVAAVTVASGMSFIMGAMSPGAQMILMMIAGHLFFPFSTVGQPIDSVNRGLAAHRLLRRVRRLPKEEQDADEIMDGGAPRQAIEFDNVSFGYPGGRGIVLRGVSVRMPAGAVIGIVGETGSGKSTLAKLLMRFYEPSGGSVRVDDVDIRRFSRGSVRAMFSVVDQRSFLFENSLTYNIDLGRSVDRTAIDVAARIACIDDFIKTLPQGYATEIGVRGTKLSDGQRQRILLARSLLVRPRVLILDEATSNLDAATERAVLTGIRELMEGRTTIVIAHRLTAVENADMIIVMKDGAVSEVGTHADLLSRQGAYAALLTSQREIRI